MNNELNIYIEKLDGAAREWMEYFVGYMRDNHSDLPEVISYQMPTYQLGTGKNRNYIAFFGAENHISVHTMDFEYIAVLKERLRKPGKGKGCVTIPYGNVEERGIVTEGIEEIIRRSNSTAR